MSIIQRQTRKARGFTLTEAAIVLGIVGLILGAIWVAAAAVYSNMRVSNTSKSLLAMVQATRSLYATSTTIDNGATAANTDITVVLGQAGAVPSDMIVKNATGVVTGAMNAWGAPFLAYVGNHGAVGDSFYILLQGVPQSACVSLLTSMTGTGRDTGLIQAGAGTGALTAEQVDYYFGPTGTGTAAQNGISAANAVAQCTGTGANTNTVGFTFRIKS